MKLPYADLAGFFLWLMLIVWFVWRLISIFDWHEEKNSRRLEEKEKVLSRRWQIYGERK